ncbi:MAG: LamG-like jellyroll fold domain-containing protein [Verrucomicrobiota bacterium]
MSELEAGFPTEEVQGLLEDLVDDQLSPERFERLQQLVRADSKVRGLYLDHCRMDAALAWEHGVLEGLGDVLNSGDSKIKRVNSWKPNRAGLGLAAAAGLMLFAWLSWKLILPEIRWASWSSGEIVGSVNRNAGGTLEVVGTGHALGGGDVIRTGSYELRNGLSELALSHDVLVRLEAPARFRLNSSQTMMLLEGRLSAEVPPQGVGFTVETPDAEVVDHGTEFGVEVSAERGSEVHVFEGEVEVTSLLAPEDPVRLETSQATRIEKGGMDPSGVQVAPDRFLRSFDEPARSFSERIRKLNPVAYYRMSVSESGKTLVDRSGHNRDGVIEVGKMERSPFASGRVGAALRLGGPSERAFAIAKRHPESKQNAMTVMAWVKADSRPRWANIVTDLLPEDTGQFRLCLSKDEGILKARLRLTDGSFADVLDAEPFVIGKWQHVAFVADGESLRLYRNGSEVNSVPCGLLATGRNSPLGVGARLVRDDSLLGYRGVEIWDGLIDEVAVYDRALKPDQVSAIYEAAEKQGESS